MSSSEIGHKKKYTYSQGDEKGICPHCGHNNSQLMGTLNKFVNSESFSSFEKNLNKCNNCNALYSNVSGAIKQLCEDTGTSFVAIQSVQQSAVMTHSSVTDSYEVQRQYKELESIKNNTGSTTNAIYFMQSSLDNLTKAVYELTQQNVKLMEKLATDPMVSIRKVVSDFNLK